MRIFLFPFLIDLVSFLVMLRLADASGREMRLSDAQTTWLMVSFSACYLVSCLVVGRLLHRENARRILVFAICLLMLVAVPLFFVVAYWSALGLFSLLGVTLALAFNSFQTFMRGEAPAGALSVAIARYTLAWSAGVSCGFFLGGLLKGFVGPLALAAFTVAACLLILWLVVGHQTAAHEGPSADDVGQGGSAPQETIAAGVDSRYVVVGWLLCLSANFSQRPLSTFIPKFHAEHQSPAWVAGCLLGAMFLAQAVGGHWCRHAQGWLYRVRPVLSAQMLVILGLALLWMAPSVWVSLAVLLPLGLCFGFIYFSAVYYASNDVHSSRNVGINEAMVGFGNILGMLVSEFSMRHLHNPLAYFPVCMGLTLLVVLAQWTWLARPGEGARTN